MAIRNAGGLLIGLALAGAVAGCASRLSVVADAPVSPPASRQDVDDADGAYRACLSDAARYADDRSATIPDVAGVIAPMCYPQFSRLEALSAQGLSKADRRALVLEGDQRQLDLAGDAIRAERGGATLSARQ